MLAGRLIIPNQVLYNGNDYTINNVTTGKSKQYRSGNTEAPGKARNRRQYCILTALAMNKCR